MSLATNVTDLATRVATECKALRTLINGNAADLTALTTTAKTNLVAAINELDAAIDALSGGNTPTTLDELTDVQITTAADGHVIRFNGTTWVNVVGTDYFQPLDAELTALAGQANTAYGRSLLNLADQAALMGLLAAATDLAPGIVELATTTEATTGTDTARAVTPAGLAAAISAANNALIDSAPGTLDTLNELAAALGDDPNFASTITTALGNRVRVDAAQTFTEPQKQQARDNIDVYSRAEVGDVTTNFVTTFNNGLV